MSSSGKGGGANKSKYVYGTLAGAVCWGPFDWLRGIIYNGGFLWQGSLNLTADVTDLTGSIADPLYIAHGGYLKFYRGTETQPADPAFPGHSPMKGTAWIAAKHLLFGKDTGAAPNLQVIGGRLPRVPTAIVAAVDNVADDDQVNPVAAFAEILLDERGGDVPEEMFDNDSWLAAAHLAYDNRDITFCSPLVTEQAALRELSKRLLEPSSGFCRWTNSGKLACCIYEWGVDPGGLAVLDARHWLKKPPLLMGDWVDVPTEIVVNFTNRDFAFQNDSTRVPDARAAQIRRVSDPKTIARPDVMRLSQAHRQGVEVKRRTGSAPAKATLEVRAAFVAGKNPGDKIKIDSDPEPGGGGLAQLVRIERIVEDTTDSARLEVMSDNLVPATPYNIDDVTPSAPEDVSPPMQYLLAVPLPPAAFGWPLKVAIVATRPSRAVWGMEVFFSDDPAHAFDDLGTQYDFAARGQLAGAISNSATTLSVTELDGLGGAEATLAANTPGGNTTAARNDTLLILLAALDGAGRIALDGDGDPIMEFVSVVERTPVSGATFSYTVLRGRLDTPARAWASGAVAWIVPRGNLQEWESTLLSSLAGLPAFFRLVSFTHAATDESSPVPECSVNMIPETAPMYERGLLGGNSASVFIYKRATSAPALPTIEATYTFAMGALTALDNGWVHTPPAGTNPLWVSLAPAFAVGPTDIIEPGEWSAAHILAQNGADGADGGPGENAATVFIYKRAATSPTLPTAPATFTFSTGVITGLNNGWSYSVPTTDGNPLWASAATAAAVGATDTISSAEWATPVKLVQDGANGSNGAAALNSSSLFIYKRSASAPALPSADSTYTFATGVITGLNNGWTQAVPGGSDPLYVSTATAISAGSTDTILSSEWAAAQILSQNGTAGAMAPSAAVSTLSSPHRLHIAAPSGAPTGWYVKYAYPAGGPLLRAGSFPFNLTVAGGGDGDYIEIQGCAPGFLDSAFDLWNWNDFNI